MTYYKNYIILFGGFQDTSQQTKYLGDLWLYDTQNYIWHNPVLPLATQKPDARSSFSLLPHELGAVLYGGYSRVKATATGKGKSGSQAQRNILKPMIHQDCFFLKIVQPVSPSPPNTPPAVRWERRKRPQNSPMPERAGATMAYHKGRGIMFGGVADVEESEEGIESEFFNQLYAWNIERNRYFPLALRKPRAVQKNKQEVRGGRRGRGQANEEELLRNLAALQTGKSLADADDMEIEKVPEEPEEPELPAKTVSMEFPQARFRAQLAVQNDVLYIYGGTFEVGDREFTLDDLYAIDLGKLDGVKEIFKRETGLDWLGEEDSEDEDDDEEEGSEEDEEDEDEEGDVEMTDAKPLFTESKRKSKKAVFPEDTTSDVSSPTTTVFDDAPEDSSTTATPDDGLPHPRPFESRRDFFARTGNEWQEALMTSLRWKGIQPETLSVKEIKMKAFVMSEEKWWECREEITALEDEQDAAGIGEVVTLADRGGDAGGKRR
jgi:hypothetical protein